MDPDDLPGYLLDAIVSAKGRGLRRLLCVLIGDATPQWQVSSRFAGRPDYHIAIQPDLATAILEALDPPAQAPGSQAQAADRAAAGGRDTGDPTPEDDAVAEMVEASGLFDLDVPMRPEDMTLADRSEPAGFFD